MGVSFSKSERIDCVIGTSNCDGISYFKGVTMYVLEYLSMRGTYIYLSVKKIKYFIFRIRKLGGREVLKIN